MKWTLTSDLKEYEGKTIPSKIEGFYFYIVSASVGKGLEIIVKDEFHERYSLFDVTTTNSKIVQQLRQEAEEMVFQWCYSVDTSLVALKENGIIGYWRMLRLIQQCPLKNQQLQYTM